MKKKAGRIGTILILSAAVLAGCGKSEEVKNVEDLIEDITATVTAEDKDSIDAAEKAWEALSDEDRKKVNGQDTLAYDIAAENYIQSVLAYNTAIDSFNKKAAEVNDANSAFNDYLEEISDSGIYNAKAYDRDTIKDLEKAVSDAQVGIEEDIAEKEPADIVNGEDTSKLKSKEKDEKISDLEEKTASAESDTASLKEETDRITVPDYSDTKKDVQEKLDAANDSVAIEDQITNPEEDFVISRLLEISGISDAQGVTEDHDPNGLLNKAGGYTAQVYFRYDAVDSSLLYKDTLIDNGTDAGGSIEVYKNQADADKRNTYLTGYDGSFIGVGSHTVLGTCIVRTSDNLTASAQKDLEAQIIKVLTRLDKD